MTNKETVARKMGEYLESKDWTVFERSSKCDECDGRCPHDAHFCPKCGVKLVPFENQDATIEMLYQAFLIGKRAEEQLDAKA